MPEKKEENYKDYITFKPEIIKYIYEKESELIGKYRPILRALRNKHMTVKEIHDIFRDPETKKHTVTRKTIYRYLEKLEEGGLIVISGHRETKGQRQIEKLYTRIAIIFYHDKDEQYMLKKEKERKRQAESIAIIIKEALEHPAIDLEELSKIVLKVLSHELKQNKEIIRKLPTNQALAEVYSRTELDELNYIANYATTLLILFKNPELIDKIKKILQAKN